MLLELTFDTTAEEIDMLNADKAKLSNENSSFWNELCGSNIARVLGVKDASPESLKRFDDWYFNFYPYLADHISFNRLSGLEVLEIGLGYGTVSQRLAESGCHYQGLDIAGGPVEMVNQRLRQNGLPGSARQGSILDPPDDLGRFDVIVAIGCLHHTGDLRSALDRCYALLKPAGRIVFMVYSAYSYRRWRQAPLATAKYALRESLGYRGVVEAGNEAERAAYDADSSGRGAPHTDWVSKRSLKHFCSRYSGFQAKYENIDQEWPFRMWTREELLRTMLPRLCGLDIYATAVK